MVPWRFLWSEVAQRPGRALLTLLSVVIGVATVLAVSISITTTRRAFQEMYQTLAGRAALQVRGDGDVSFDIGVADAVGSAPGVKAAVPLLVVNSVLYSQGERFQLMVLGISPEKEKHVREYIFAEGDSFPEGNEILLEAGFARLVNKKLGDEVRLLTRRGPHQFRLAGLLAPEGAAAFQGGSVVFMPLDTAQYWFRTPGRVNTIDVVLDEGASEDVVARELSQRLPPGFSVTPPSTRTELSRETLFLAEQGLNMAAALSLVAAAFIIVNSLWMSITERRRRLATLRTIGATRMQVFSLIMREGLLLGVAGTFLGIGLGIGGAALLTRVMERMFQTSLPVFHLDIGSLLSAAALGLMLSLAAVLLPAWTATRISPLEGMRTVPAESSPGGRRGASAIGFALVGIAVACGVLLGQGLLPPTAAPPVVACAVVGMAMLIPLWMVAVVRLLSGLLERVGSVNAFLACRQILRQRSRSGLTAGVLFVAVVMSVAMGNNVVSNIEDVKDWVDRTVTGDFVIRGSVLLDLTTGAAPAVPEGLAERAAALPGVVSVEPWTFAHTTAEGRSVMVVARSFPEGAPLALDLYQAGDEDEVRRRLFQGEAVMSTVIAQRMGKKVGDTITLATEHGPEPMRIAATCDDYIMGGTVIYVQSGIARERLGLLGVQALVLRVQPDRRAEAETALRDLCDKNGLLLQPTAELAEAIHKLTRGVNAALWAMLAVGFVVASFGLANTLTMNVLEQTRELGLLRMVGMTRLQVGRYVLSQAAVLGVAGLLPGAAAGELTAYFFNRVGDFVLGHPVAFDLRPEVIAGCLAFGFLLAIAAACLPAVRAARLLIGAAIQYE
jgi:putative ABC transport system permease protein